jgi:DNA-binding transcriptional ArsR family regulator
MPSPKPVTDITDPRWLRAISHPVRVRLLAMLDEDQASPVILASKLDQPLGTIAYHVRTLYDLGLLKLVRTRQRRGATEHYYRTVALPRGADSSLESVDPDSWAALDPVSKQRLLTASIVKTTDYATRSAAAGGFDSDGAHISITSLKLDSTGWDALSKELRKLLAKLGKLEQDAATRTAANPAAAIDVGLALMLFEALPFSAGVPSA